jgi:transposase
MQTNSDTPKKLYVGLDVHKEKTVPALLGPGRSDEPEAFRVFQTTQHGLEKAMRAICKAKGLKQTELHVCYEANGCGFWIARRLGQMRIT